MSKIDDLYLYTAFDENSLESLQVKKFLDDNKIVHEYLHYFDLNQSVENKNVIQTWFPTQNIEKYPFLVYSIVDDELPPSKWGRGVLVGKDILDNIIAMYSEGR